MRGQLSEALLCTHLTSWRDLLSLHSHYCLLAEPGQGTQQLSGLTR